MLKEQKIPHAPGCLANEKRIEVLEKGSTIDLTELIKRIERIEKVLHLWIK